MVRYVLNAVSPKFQITMTHYRSDGTAQGKVLFGIKVPDTERPALEQALNSTEMQWEDMTDTMAFKLLYGCEVWRL